MSVHNLRLAKMRLHVVWVHKMWLDHVGHGCLMSMKLSRHMVVSSSDLRMDDKPAVNSRVMDLLLVSKLLMSYLMMSLLMHSLLMHNLLV